MLQKIIFFITLILLSHEINILFISMYYIKLFMYVQNFTALDLKLYTIKKETFCRYLRLAFVAAGATNKNTL